MRISAHANGGLAPSLCMHAVNCQTDGRPNTRILRIDFRFYLCYTKTFVIDVLLCTELNVKITHEHTNTIYILLYHLYFVTRESAKNPFNIDDI